VPGYNDIFIVEGNSNIYLSISVLLLDLLYCLVTDLNMLLFYSAEDIIIMCSHNVLNFFYGFIKKSFVLCTRNDDIHKVTCSFIKGDFFI